MAVINWFTKRLQYLDEDLETVRERLLSNIAEKSHGLGGLRSFGDVVSRAMEYEKALRYIPSDTRLRTCPLYHHIRSTAGISVVLAQQKGYPDEMLQVFRICGLLHDLGKLVTPGKTEHVRHTSKLVNELLGSCELKIAKPVLHRIAYLAPRHHSASYYNEFQATNEDERLLSLADSISSAIDRRYEVSKDGSLYVTSNDRIFPHFIDDGDSIKVLKYGEPARIGRKENGDIIGDLTLHGDGIVVSEYPPLEGNIGLLGFDVQGIQSFISSSKKLPGMKGGSIIVDRIGEEAVKIISRHLCPETVLFKGGGNMVSFVPIGGELTEVIKQEIKEKTDELTAGGTSAAIAVLDFNVDSIVNEFGSCLEKLFNETLRREKNVARIKGAGRQPKLVRDVCSHCSQNIATHKSHDEKICDVCHIKAEVAHEEDKYRKRSPCIESPDLLEPYQLQHIGKNIAVLVFDGNMVGRMFAQTTTPAEYGSKSEMLDTGIKEIVRKTRREALEEISDLVTYDFYEEESSAGKYFAIKELYSGGDDLFFIVRAKAAFWFAERLISNFARHFRFVAPDLPEGASVEGGENMPEKMDTPVFTLSCGVAFGSNRFPIYFLIDKARALERTAKDTFRRKVTTNGLGLFELPEGSLAFSVVSSSMPSQNDFSFVFPDDRGRYERMSLFVRRSGMKGWKQLLSLVLNTEGLCDPDPPMELQLNLIKFLYSHLDSKSLFTDAARNREDPVTVMRVLREIVDVVDDNELVGMLGSVVPLMWRD